MVAITKNATVRYDISLRDDDITVTESEALDLLNKLHGALNEEIEPEEVNVYSTTTFTFDNTIKVYIDNPLSKLKLIFPAEVFDAMVYASGYYSKASLRDT